MLAIKLKVDKKYDSCFKLKPVGFCTGYIDEEKGKFHSNSTDEVIDSISFLDKRNSNNSFYAFPASVSDICKTGNIYEDMKNYYESVEKDDFYLFYDQFGSVLYSTSESCNRCQFVNWDKKFDSPDKYVITKDEKQMMKKYR